MSQNIKNSYIGKIKHQFASNQQVYELLTGCDLMKHLAFTGTFKQFDQKIEQEPELLKSIVDYLPWITIKDPVIKQFQKNYEKDVTYKIIKIHRPIINNKQAVETYYRIIVPV